MHTLGPVGLSKGLSCEAGSFSCCHLNPHGCFQLGVLRLYFPALEPWVKRSALLPAVRPGLSVRECGAAVSATHHSACPVLHHSESSPLSLSVQECECGAAGSASGRTACPIVPHSASLGPTTATRVLSARPSPPLLPVWMNVYFVFPGCWTPLPFDFLSVLVVRGGAVCLPTPPSWFRGKTFKPE